MKIKLILLLLIIVTLFLSIYGNNWGLPSRWYADEKVSNVLHMIAKKTFVDVYDFYYHPTGYQMLLGIFLVPFLVYLKLSGYPLDALKEAASVSWIHMARLFPDFAVNIYIYSRILSAILGVITVYMVFLMGKRLYNEKTGLISAALLSVTMGFAAVNHFAKHISLINLLIVVSLFFAIRGRLLWAAFFVGFSCSVQLNGFLLTLPLLTAFIYNYKGFGQFLKVSIAGSVFYIIGFIIGTPSVLYSLPQYLKTFNGLFLTNATAGAESRAPFFVGPANYLFELLSIYGVFIFFFIICGIIYALINWRNTTKGEVIIDTFVIAYLLIMTVLFTDKYPQTKHIIAIVPLLVLFGGRAISIFLENRKISVFLKYLIVAFVFLYSFVYIIKADMVFAKDDTRYASTEWIRKNVPKGSTIEVFNQIHFVFEECILDNYEIIYMGHSSKEYNQAKIPRWVDVSDRDEYVKHLNKDDSLADYIAININHMDKLYAGKFLSYIPGLDSYVKDLFEGKRNFKLVKVFRPKNKKVMHKNLGNIIIFEDIFWNPIPDYESVSPTIYIFKKNKS